jgi:hypothetical protein
MARLLSVNVGLPRDIAQSSTDRSHSTNRPMATFWFAAHSRSAMSSSICKAVQLDDQNGAKSSSATRRGFDRNGRRGETSQRNSRVFQPDCRC